MSEDRWDDPKHIKWSRAVKTRDFFTCQICGTGGYEVHLESHHMNSYDWAVNERYDLTNGVTLCKKCHTQYHQYTSFGNNTKQDFLKFMKLAKIFRQILSSDHPENSPKEAREIEEILNTEDEPNDEGEE